MVLLRPGTEPEAEVAAGLVGMMKSKQEYTKGTRGRKVQKSVQPSSEPNSGSANLPHFFYAGFATFYQQNDITCQQMLQDHNMLQSTLGFYCCTDLGRHKSAV